MVNFSIILLIIVLLALKIILISLFVKFLNLIKEISNTHILLHEDLLQIRLNLNKIENEKLLKDFKNKNINKPIKNNNETTELKSSSISKEELEKLMEGKELAFKKDIHIKPGEMFVNTDIDL